MTPMELSPNTKFTVQVGVVVSIIGLIVTGTWMVAAAATRLGTLERDHYGIASAAEQALRMAMENPGLRVPDPRNPERMIVVPGAAPVTFSK